jgi:hypothetical protein
MTKNRKKTILQHCALWGIWYLINTLQLVGIMSTFKTKDWMQLAYNYISLILVFYAIVWLLAGFYRIFSVQMYSTLRGVNKVRYLFNTRLLLALAVTALYVGVSVVLDNIFFGYEYPTALSHIIQRLTRVLLYVVIADRFANFANYKRRVRNYVIKNETRFKNLEADTYKIKELYEQLADEKLRN